MNTKTKTEKNETRKNDRPFLFVLECTTLLHSTNFVFPNSALIK